jgi:hypothetical protein
MVSDCDACIRACEDNIENGSSRTVGLARPGVSTVCCTQDNASSTTNEVSANGCACVDIDERHILKMIRGAAALGCPTYSAVRRATN